jgi:hypothetical protein
VKTTRTAASLDVQSAGVAPPNGESYATSPFAKPPKKTSPTRCGQSPSVGSGDLRILAALSVAGILVSIESALCSPSWTRYSACVPVGLAKRCGNTRVITLDPQKIRP